MSNYNKTPFFSITGQSFTGWDSIREGLNYKINNSLSKRYILVVECYQGVYHKELIDELNCLKYSCFIHSEEAFYPEEKILEMTYPDVTDDVIFGYMSRLSYNEFLDTEKIEKRRNKIQDRAGLVIVYGHVASLICEGSSR